MKKSIVTLFIWLLLLSSCKSKQAVVAEQAADGKKKANELIAGHLEHFKDFNTLLIKSNVYYKDAHNSQRLNAEVRIKKDEIILVSVRFLGITMAKARITPNEVSYYEKMSGTFFRGDYAVLSRWLGTELDFNTVQNIFIARASLSPKINYTSFIKDGQYNITGSDNNGLMSQLVFEGANYLLKQEHVVQQGLPQRTLDIKYPSYTEADGMIMPAEITIEAEQEDVVNINIGYTSIKFNEELSFPYDVPEGFEQIFIE
ncbi:DUF4292 domain-containing protein [Flavobacterium rhizosphaerae]|uniref:DUF4292 domain-containing protein n=1 Tax=Flavobacterium rhizosphaerae TaxID=3163298 RepID=A0ABW8Z1T3_9FLAO